MGGLELAQQGGDGIDGAEDAAVLEDERDGTGRRRALCAAGKEDDGEEDGRACAGYVEGAFVEASSSTRKAPSGRFLIQR
jgi:hypothetical protein